MSTAKIATDMLQIENLSAAHLQIENLQLANNSLIAVLGEAGSGKTVLLHDVLLRESLKRITLNGCSVLWQQRPQIHPLNVSYQTLAGLRPVVSLNTLAADFSKMTSTLGELLLQAGDLESLLEKSVLPSCPDDGAGLIDGGLPRTVCEIRKHYSGAFLLLFLTRRGAPTELCLQLELDRAAGFSRLLWAEKLKRLAPDETVSEQDLVSGAYQLLLASFAVDAELELRLNEGLELARRLGAVQAELCVVLSSDLVHSKQPLAVEKQFAITGGYSCEHCKRIYSKAEVAALLARAPLAVKDVVGAASPLGLAAAALNLGSLQLSSPVKNLSPGERLKLAILHCVLAGMSEAIFLLDDFSAQFSICDQARALSGLRQLVSSGSIVLVADDNRSALSSADQWLVLNQGRLVFQGLPALAPKGFLAPPTLAKFEDGETRAAKLELLPDVVVPRGALIVVTGDAGSGKSRFLTDAARHLGRDSRLEVEFVGETQLPISRGKPRSLAATCGALKLIAELFSALPASRVRGFAAKMFDLERRGGGACLRCQGQGTERLVVEFVGEQFEVCEACGGQRYQPQVLDVQFGGNNISSVLSLAVRDALALFKNQPAIVKALSSLQRSGLGEMRLGDNYQRLSSSARARLQLNLSLAQRSRMKDFVLIADQILDFASGPDLLDSWQMIRELIQAGGTVILSSNRAEIVKCGQVIFAAADFGVFLKQSANS